MYAAVAAEDTGSAVLDVLVIGGIFREVLDADSKPRRRYGGSGFTAAIAAARLGARVALASYVGQEDEEAVRGELRVAGVDDHAVITVTGASGTFVFPTVEDSDRPWPMYRPAESVPAERPQELPPALVVVAFGIPDYDPVAAGWLNALGRDVTLIWDRQGWLSRARDSRAILALRPARKLYLANETEAVEDAGTDGMDELLAVQPPAGFEVAVIKRGVNGVLVFERSNAGIQMNAVRSFPVAAASTVGTGDVFAGAFAARLARGDSPTEAARWGCAAAAVALESGTNVLNRDADTAIRRYLFPT